MKCQGRLYFQQFNVNLFQEWRFPLKGQKEMSKTVYKENQIEENVRLTIGYKPGE